MVAILTLLAVAALTYAQWSALRQWAYPPIILGGAWLFTLLVYCADEDRLESFRFDTGLMIAAGFLVFSLGALVPVLRRTRRSTERAHPSAPRLRSGDWIIAIAALGLPFFLLKVVELALSGPSESPAINLRLAISMSGGDTKPLGLLEYLQGFSIYGAGLHALGLVRTTPFRSRLMFGLATVYALAGSGRTAFLMLVVIVGGGLALSGKISRWTLLALGGGSFLLVFGVGAFLMNKGISGTSSISADFAATFTAYLLGGTAGLNDYLAAPGPLDWGQNTFRGLIAVLHRLNLGPEPRSLVMEFRSVPFETNVYTVFRPYFADFGWAGALGFQALFGFLHGLVYTRARSGRRGSLFIYALLLYPLVMQVFQDQYFSLLSSWMQALLLLFVATARFSTVRHAPPRPPPNLPIAVGP